VYRSVQHGRSAVGESPDRTVSQPWHRRNRLPTGPSLLTLVYQIDERLPPSIVGRSDRKEKTLMVSFDLFEGQREEPSSICLQRYGGKPYLT